MAFVFRNQNQTQPRSQTPGPAFYRINKSTNEDKAISPAPFNQTSPRKIWKDNKNPGPTDYSIEPKKDQQSFIFQSGNKIYTLNASSQTAIFRSASQRFKQIKQASPGPGNYILNKEKEIKQKYKQQHITQHSNLQKYLKAIHERKNIDEEPDLVFMFRQENVDNQVRRNQLNPKHCEKKVVPFNSSMNRIDKERPKTSVGPGSYNIQQKKEKNNQKTKNLKQQIHNSLAKFVKISATEDIIIKKQQLSLESMFNSEKSRNYISSVIKKSELKKDDFFGSTVSRFYSTQITKTPGPGDYNINSQQQNNNINKKQKKSNVCFGSSASNPVKYIVEKFVSPFGERRQSKKVNMKDDKTVKGSFGSSQARFKTLKNNDASIFERGPLQIGTIGNKQKMTQKTLKKYRKAERIQKIEQKDERPLCYASQSNTLESKVGFKYQINAPFSSQVPRFYQNLKQNNSIEAIIHQERQYIIKQQKKKRTKNKSKGLMQSKNPRFVYRQHENSLSPCSYNPNIPSKKEFNKLFI